MLAGAWGDMCAPGRPHVAKQRKDEDPSSGSFAHGVVRIDGTEVRFCVVQDSSMGVICPGALIATGVMVPTYL